MYLFSVTICLLAAYGVLMALYTRGHWKLRAFATEGKTPITKFSSVIPARNEAANIEACIAGILAQNYPTDLFEVIIIDDFSEDETAISIGGNNPWMICLFNGNFYGSFFIGTNIFIFCKIL